MLKQTTLQGDESNASASSRTLRQDLQANSLTNQMVEGSPRKRNDQPRDQLTNLETQLQSKEARLNWMLEALVGIPAPLRETQPDPIVRGKLTGGVGTDQQEAAPAKRVLPVLVESPPAPSQIESAADQPPTSIKPVRRRAPSPPTENHTPADRGSAGNRRSRADAFTKSHQLGYSEPTTSTTQSEQVKAASILKLVGSGSSDVSGKSREDLIEDYKRARRVELEAMMRTMVQK
ncbi:unnamed protein product [Phytophthora lilii]|uniref:Unnamed protein product n=1 Tax=Phytophthora lilii TaxID=2077276 RepID=A0A9W6U195_9STRA|nr:unnamed protein product [Phytophthora lilii]